MIRDKQLKYLKEYFKNKKKYRCKGYSYDKFSRKEQYPYVSCEFCFISVYPHNNCYYCKIESTKYSDLTIADFCIPETYEEFVILLTIFLKDINTFVEKWEGQI